MTDYTAELRERFAQILGQEGGKALIYQAFCDKKDVSLHYFKNGINSEAYFAYARANPEGFGEDATVCALVQHAHDRPEEALRQAGILFQAYEPDDYELLSEFEFWGLVGRRICELSLSGILATMVDALMSLSRETFRNDSPGCHPHPMYKAKIPA